MTSATVTPLGLPLTSLTWQQPSKADKVLLKAVNKKGKKDPKTFTLRNINELDILSCDDLKSVIRRKLSSDIATGNFDVGYLQGSAVVRMRTPEHLEELWSLLK